VRPATGGAPAPAVVRAANSACVRAGGRSATLEVPLSSTQAIEQTPFGAPPYALTVRYRMLHSASVLVGLAAAQGAAGRTDARPVWARGSGGQLVPLRATAPAGRRRSTSPTRACVTSLSLGRLRYVGAGAQRPRQRT
jgi:hypothetical protein